MTCNVLGGNGVEALYFSFGTETPEFQEHAKDGIPVLLVTWK
jgi:hypothetical protein